MSCLHVSGLVDEIMKLVTYLRFVISSTPTCQNRFKYLSIDLTSFVFFLISTTFSFGIRDQDDHEGKLIMKNIDSKLFIISFFYYQEIDIVRDYEQGSILKFHIQNL